MSANIKTWQDRRAAYYDAPGSKQLMRSEHFKDQEIAELRAALATTTPTVAVDEREAFEAWASERGYWTGGMQGIESAEGWYYFDDETNDAWEVWLARAKLSAGRAQGGHVDASASGVSPVPKGESGGLMGGPAPASVALSESLVKMIAYKYGIGSEVALPFARELFAESAGVAIPEGWQPIETAPKDATHILICRATNASGEPIGEAFGLFTQRAAWWAGEDGGRGAWIVYSDMIMEPTCFFEPTHWMPIPAAPSPDQQGE